MSVGELAMVVLRRQFAKVLAHEPGTRLGEDPEALHDMRVAIRRMRVAFKLFAPYLPARSLVLRDELKWAGSALGEVRDLDVHLAGVLAWGRKLDAEDAEALTGLAAPLRTQRAAARRRMIRALDSRRFERLVERMTATLVRGPLRSGVSQRAAALAVGPELIERCYGRVLKSARRLKRSSPPERFHRLRIRFKALRYALEFHRELYGKAADEAIRALTGLQDVLGEHQDADVATQWLRTLVQQDGRSAFPADRVRRRHGRGAIRPAGPPSAAAVSRDLRPAPRKALATTGAGDGARAGAVSHVPHRRASPPGADATWRPRRRCRPPSLASCRGPARSSSTSEADAASQSGLLSSWHEARAW